MKKNFYNIKIDLIGGKSINVLLMTPLKYDFNDKYWNELQQMWIDDYFVGNEGDFDNDKDYFLDCYSEDIGEHFYNTHFHDLTMEDVIDFWMEVYNPDHNYDDLKGWKVVDYDPNITPQIVSLSFSCWGDKDIFINRNN